MKKEERFYTTALLALLTVSAYFLADIADSLIGKSLDMMPPAAAAPRRDRSVLNPGREFGFYSAILDSGLFGDGVRPAAGPAVSTNYKLIGTVEGEVFSGAVLDDGTGQAFYRKNQKMPDGSVIVKVDRNRVAIRKTDNAIVSVELVDDTKIVAFGKNNGGNVQRMANNRFLVDQREVLASTENMSQILTQARALPYMEQGKTKGFRISEIVPGSIYSRIGLQNGDIIQRVNSQELDNPAKFFQLYQGLKNESNITIDVVRNGQSQTLNYEIR